MTPTVRRQPRLTAALCLACSMLCVSLAGASQFADGPQAPRGEATANELPLPVAAGSVQDRPPEGTAVTSDRKSGAAPKQRPLSMFFVVGIAINLLMGVILGLWAYREWRS